MKNGLCMRKVAVVALLAMSMGMAGCNNSKGPVIATVGEQSIYEADFEAFLKHKRIALQNEQAVAKALDTYLKQEAQALAVQNAQLLDDALINAEVHEFKKQLLINRYYEQYLAEQASEQAMLNYYNTHKADFASQQAKVAHILMRVRAGAGDNEKAAALTRAREAYTMLGRGQSFAVVAAQYSDDERTKKLGGDLGWITQGAVSPAFTEAAFKTPQGSYSQPVLSPLGYHIVTVLETPKTIQKPFEAVAGNIRYTLRQAAKQAEQQRLIDAVTIQKAL
ncbi:peptidylprolyl isomerase [Marinagarivorans algicola]|uniref:peptidylprolyl isomerase n=1 Tax=Marinagarivorans algicola TaxID=1513270 RepID=UPI00138F24A5|nr:peptidylprolyl isomerase [Marinagarivorans algicola]